MSLNPDHLLTFIAVAEAANISHAAKALHLSQPAVSAQLRGLQDWFGGPLYRRAGQGVALTDAGLSLLPHARRLRATLAQADEVRADYAGLVVGKLRLGASITPASYLLPNAVAAFRQRHPAVALSLADGNTSEIVERLDGLDLAFIEGDLPAALPPDCAEHEWREDEVMAIVQSHHPLAAQTSASLDQIAACPWVTREPGSGLRGRVERVFAEAGHVPVTSLELAGFEAVKHAVRAGLGVGFVSSLALRHEDASLIGLRIGQKGLWRTIRILVPHASSPTRATKAFLDTLISARSA